MPICLHCGKYTRNAKFCNSSHSALYNNKRRTYSPKQDKRTKKIYCCSCNKPIEVNIRAPKYKTKCSTCKNKNIKRKNKRCKICGRLNCRNSKLCKWLLNGGLKILPKFGTNLKYLGTLNIFDEVEGIALKLIHEYNELGDSTPILSQKYGVHDKTIVNFIKRFNPQFCPRTYSEAGRLGSLKGRVKPFMGFKKQMIKSQWHVTWFDQQVFLRSNFEKLFAEYLDKSKTYYEVEALRIVYLDVSNKERIYLPDFYLPKTKTIIELKNWYHFYINFDNIVKKLQACQYLGYCPELIVGGDLINHQKNKPTIYKFFDSIEVKNLFLLPGNVKKFILK